MEIRVLRYFLEIAREGSMTAAAGILHVSQSALSKQMKELEEELGKKLFRRKSRSVSLTEEGILLRRRAEDILDMVDKTTEEFKAIDDLQGGDVYLGCAESCLIAHIARKIRHFRQRYPLFHYHIISGDRTVVLDRLDRGLLDFGVIVEAPDPDRYQYLEIPGADTWGVILPKDHPLAKKQTVRVDDLYGEELICSEQSVAVDIPRWCGKKAGRLNFTGNTNLAYNGSIFVKEGLGLMLSFEHLIQPSEENGLVFRPLEPKLENKMYLIWKKYQVFSPIAYRVFITDLTGLVWTLDCFLPEILFLLLPCRFFARLFLLGQAVEISVSLCWYSSVRSTLAYAVCSPLTYRIATPCLVSIRTGVFCTYGTSITPTNR